MGFLTWHLTVPWQVTYNTPWIPALESNPIKMYVIHVIDSNRQRKPGLIVSYKCSLPFLLFFMMFPSKVHQIVYELSKLILLEEPPGCLLYYDF